MPTSFTTMPRWAGRYPSLRRLKSSGVSTLATLLVYAGSANAHHLIATLLKLIRHLLDRHVEALSPHRGGNRIDVARRHCAEREQWKDPDFIRHPAHFQNRRTMKRLV